MPDRPEKPEEGRDLVQIRNPRSGLYVKLDRSNGTIVGHKDTPGPYDGITIVPPKVTG